MSDKKLTIKVKNNRLGMAIQRLAFRHGFRWNDGICKMRDCGENKFYLEIDFRDGTLKFLPFFAEVEDYIQFKDSYEVESDFDVPPEAMALKRAFQRYQKEWILEVKEPIVNKVRVPKYPTFVKERGQPFCKIGSVLRVIDDI